MRPHTDRLCPACPEPCCRKPTRVSEYDILIAEACGYAFPSANQSAQELLDRGFAILTGDDEVEAALEPCDYLGEKGCRFPDDLRPYECARYICRYLRESMSSAEMRDVRALLHKLELLHTELLRSISPLRRTQNPRSETRNGPET